MTFSRSIHIYICQSCDCCIFSLVTILGNMYNLCKLHSLICMCSNMHSSCHSLSKCTFLYNCRYKYGYETCYTNIHWKALLTKGRYSSDLGFVLVYLALVNITLMYTCMHISFYVQMNAHCSMCTCLNIWEVVHSSRLYT